MKWIKVTISVITFIAITSIGEAFSSDFDSYSKSKIEDQKLEEKKKNNKKLKQIKMMCLLILLIQLMRVFNKR